MSAGEDESPRQPSSFQGWQRGACIVGVILIAVLAVLLLVGVVLGVFGVG